MPGNFSYGVVYSVSYAFFTLISFSDNHSFNILASPFILPIMFTALAGLISSEDNPDMFHGFPSLPLLRQVMYSPQRCARRPSRTLTFSDIAGSSPGSCLAISSFNFEHKYRWQIKGRALGRSRHPVGDRNGHPSPLYFLLDTRFRRSTLPKMISFSSKRYRTLLQQGSSHEEHIRAT